MARQQWRRNSDNRRRACQPHDPAQESIAIASSYDEEKAAVCMTLEWLLPSLEAAAICTDSQSLLKVTQSSSADTSNLRHTLNKWEGMSTRLWIPGHHRIAGNEEADDCAKQAAAITDGAPRLLRGSQPTIPPNTIGSATLSLQNKEGQNKKIRGRLTARPLSFGATLFSSPAYELVASPPQ